MSGCCLPGRDGSAGGGGGGGGGGAFRLGSRLNNNTRYSSCIAIHPQLSVRNAFGWSSTQPTSTSPYNWATLDGRANAADAAGADWFAVVSLTPAWASINGQAGNYPPNDMAAFSAFMSAGAARYKGRIKVYEIYNEPNFRGWTAAQVKSTLIAASNAIRAADPNAKVAGICMGVPPRVAGGTSAKALWDTLMADAAVRSAMDIVTFHFYVKGNPGFPPEIGDSKGPIYQQTVDSIAMIRASGFTGEIWNTEGGWPTDYPGNTFTSNLCSEADQARWLVRYGILTAAAGIDCWYQFQAFGNVTAGSEAGGMGMTRPDGTDKPSMAAFKTLCNMLMGASVPVKIPSAAEVYAFTKADGGQARVVYAITGTAAATLTGLTSTVRKTLIDGTSSTVVTSGGSLSLTATVDPVWIEML